MPPDPHAFDDEEPTEVEGAPLHPLGGRVVQVELGAVAARLAELVRADIDRALARVRELAAADEPADYEALGYPETTWGYSDPDTVADVTGRLCHRWLDSLTAPTDKET